MINTVFFRLEEKKNSKILCFFLLNQLKCEPPQCVLTEVCLIRIQNKKIAIVWQIEKTNHILQLPNRSHFFVQQKQKQIDVLGYLPSTNSSKKLLFREFFGNSTFKQIMSQIKLNEMSFFLLNCLLPSIYCKTRTL